MASAAPTASSSSTPSAKKRTRRSLNCEPCRLHKLKCNRARPCSGCVYRGTQNMCFPNYAEPAIRKSSSSQAPHQGSGSHSGSLRNAANQPPDPLAELNQMQTSLSALQRHYRTVKKHGDADLPAPEPALYQDALMGSETQEAFFAGPTHSCTGLFNYFEHFPTSGPPPADSPSSDAPNLYTTVLSQDLVAWLPNKAALQILIMEYIASATWFHRFVDEVEVKDKLERYIDKDELDELTLAQFFVLSAISLHYIQWDHKIRRNWPEDSNVTANRFYEFACTIIERSRTTLTSRPTLAFLELQLLLAHYHEVVKLGDSGEQMWVLGHKLVELALAMGLHRDPGDRDLPEADVAKRRWVWWNILGVERTHCLLLGRPMTISNSHFDTKFPIEPGPPDQEASENMYLPYLAVFRYTHVLGFILDDLHNVVTLMTPERAALHDVDLHKWRETWPPDMELSEYAIATSLARTQDEGVQRRGIQSLYLIANFHYLRFILHRPVRIPGTREIMANSASALVGLVNRCVHDIMLNPRLAVSGQIGVGPYLVVLAGLFYSHALLENPDQPGAPNFRANLVDAHHGAAVCEPIPVALRITKLLGPTSFIAPPPAASMNSPDGPGMDSKTTAEVAYERISMLRRVTFPYVGLPHDICDIEQVLPMKPGEVEGTRASSLGRHGSALTYRGRSDSGNGGEGRNGSGGRSGSA